MELRVTGTTSPSSLVKVVESYVNKGKEIAIEGKLTSRSYETKDGEKRYITEIVCNDLVMLSK